MLYSAEELQPSVIDEAMALLEGANYLTEAESRYYPEMVPIRENDRLQTKLLRMEDLVEYALANGVSDAGIAIHQICEASNINPAELSFTVDEINLLEDHEMEETVKNILKTNPQVQFYTAPISENDMASIITNATVYALAEAIDQGEPEYGYALFEAYVDNDFETLFSEDYVVNQIYSMGRSNHISSMNESADVVNYKIESAINEAYNNINMWDAKKISALRTLSINLNESGNEDSSINNYILQAINHLSTQIKR